jgi:16S rRNA (guanine527-N7)-methyltransferase
VTREADERRQLEAGAAALGYCLGDDQIDTLIAYLDRLYRWNRSAGLTTVMRADAVRLHLLDSLATIAAVAGSASLADLGSGAGLPGIPLAVAIPELEVCLVESRRRRCSFLAETVRDLGLSRCRVIDEDVRAYARAGATFDAVIARAFLSPADLVAVAGPMLAPRGRVVLMCGPSAPDPAELAGASEIALRPAFSRSLRLPDGGERRTVLALERHS